MKEIPCNLPNIPLTMDGDPISMYNIRTWVEQALIAKGAEITGKGVGVNVADLDFELEGQKFNIEVKPR